MNTSFWAQFSSILLYLAWNVLISWSSLMSRDPMMNTSEPTALVFLRMSLAMYVYLGQVCYRGIPRWIPVSPHLFCSFVSRSQCTYISVKFAIGGSRDEYFWAHISSVLLYPARNVLIQCSYWMFLLCKDTSTVAPRGIFPHIFTSMLQIYHVHNRWFLISGLWTVQK